MRLTSTVLDDANSISGTKPGRLPGRTPSGRLGKEYDRQLEEALDYVEDS